MTDFLIKSTISLFVLLALYHLVLEKEKMHQFNRFYLLFGLVFSISIPFYTIEIIKKIAAAPIAEMEVIQTVETSVIQQDNTNYLEIGSLIIYCIITAILLIRFAYNFLQFNKKKQNNPSIKHENKTVVLLEDITLPYTFLNTIFMNKSDYESKKIEPELFTHELIHVNQKHTLDILFIEILKTIFWFNPIFIFYKKAIQLNHEFLADEKVVKSHNNVSYYQNLLIAKAYTNPTYYLASNLNYSVTKKRLIMMTKNASNKQALIKKAIVLPILIGLVFLLCTKTVAQVATEKEGKNIYVTGEAYYKKTSFKIKDEKGKVIAQKKYSDLTAKQKKLAPPLVIRSNNDKPLSEKEIIKKIKKEEPKTFIIDEFDPKNFKTKKEDSNAIYTTADISENPEYPGGMEKFYQFISENFKIPTEAGLKGKVYVTFVIEKDGSLSNFKILRDIGYGTGEETIRVLKLSQNWTPGTIEGEAVRTSYSLPISIQSKT